MRFNTSCMKIYQVTDDRDRIKSIQRWKKSVCDSCHSLELGGEGSLVPIDNLVQKIVRNKRYAPTIFARDRIVQFHWNYLKKGNEKATMQSNASMKEELAEWVKSNSKKSWILSVRRELIFQNRIPNLLKIDGNPRGSKKNEFSSFFHQFPM